MSTTVISSTKKLIPVFAVAALLTFALGGEAEAGHGGWGRGHGCYTTPVFPTHPSPHFGHGGHSSHYPGFGWQRPTWHDTSHFDYHPPQLVPHGNHFDYQPGHFDFHRTGHWDH
jgi:hypothetical protein